MSKKRRYDELLVGEMCISLVNEPIIEEIEVPPLTALEKAKGRWGSGRVIEGRREDATRSNANDKRAKSLRGDLSI